MFLEPFLLVTEWSFPGPRPAPVAAPAPVSAPVPPPPPIPRSSHFVGCCNGSAGCKVFINACHKAVAASTFGCT